MNFKKLQLTCIIICLIVCTANAQPSFSFASKIERIATTNRLTKMVDSTIEIGFTQNNYKTYQSAFWAMELMLYKPTKFYLKIDTILNNLVNTSADFQRAFLEMLYTLYPKKYSKKVILIWKNLATPKNKAMALEYLSLNQIQVKTPKYTVDSLQLFYFKKNKTAKNKYVKQLEILSKKFLPNQMVVVSFQFSNRNKPGYLMIRTKEHKWLTVNGNLFKVPQLARSITNLPYYLTNGNTPQGLYKLNGFAVSDNNYIGPTTNLQMSLPFEITNDSFFLKSVNTTKEAYQMLLGNLANYDNLWQSYYAGSLGRSEIIAHGTAINPNYYKKEMYYPNTPSLGCLCASELWDESGKRKYSAQQEFIDVLKNIGGGFGYFLVVETN